MCIVSGMSVKIQFESKGQSVVHIADNKKHFSQGTNIGYKLYIIETNKKENHSKTLKGETSMHCKWSYHLKHHQGISMEVKKVDKAVS